MSDHEFSGGSGRAHRAHHRVKMGASAIAYALIGVAILVVVNLIAHKLPTKLGSFQTDWRWDMTESKRFSLAPQTSKILGGLDRDITIRYFDRKNNLTGSVKDLLDQFPAQS